MNSSWHPRARWLMVTLLVSAVAVVWELGADASRVRVVVRFLAGQRVSLGSASASDSFVILSSLAEILLLGAGLVLFLGWRRRPGARTRAFAPRVAVWWVLWVGANIVGRLVELTYRATTSLTDLRNVTLLDAADSVALGVSLLAMMVAVRRRERRGLAQAGTARPRTQVGAITAGVACLIVAPFALAFVVSNGTMAASRAPSTPSSAAAAWQASNAAASACPDAMFQPSGAIAAGLSSPCGDVTLGSSLLNADCTKGAIPTGLSPEIFDSTGQASTLGTVAAAAGGCEVTTKSTSVTSAVLAGDSTGPINEPGAVVIVADFLPSSNAAGVNTIGVRVSSSSEFDVALQSGGQYAVIESTNGATPLALLQGSFTVGRSGAPDLSREVRVVVAIQGSTAAAYVDGVLLGRGPTTVPNQPGGCGFSVSTNDASHPVIATLVRLQIFAAG